MAGGIRKNAGSLPEENSDINIVPFIDIMLVLLIIFMVAAPLATVDVNVDLPASTAKPTERPDKPLYVSLKDDLSVHVGDEAVARDQLGLAIDRFTEGDKEKRVFLRADKSVDYEHLMELMNLLRSGGYLKIALVGLESMPAPTPTTGNEGDQPAIAGGLAP